MKKLIQTLTATKVVPVVKIENVDRALPMAEALQAGGINVVEVTLRSESGMDAAKRIKRAIPDMIVGIGTVITTDQIDACVDMDADFVVTPGTSHRLAAHLAKTGIAAVPGIATPGEAVTMLEYGFDVLKFFPAEASGGIPTLKAIGGPLPQIRFMATGGIKPGMVRDYLDLPSIIAVGGSWVVDQQSLESKNWAQITQNAERAVSF